MHSSFFGGILVIKAGVRRSQYVHDGGRLGYFCGTVEMNPTRNHYEVAGLIPGLAQWLAIWHCRDLWCKLQRRGSDLALLWL